MGVSVKSRASLAMKATTAAEPAQVLGVIKDAAGAVRGGGTSLLTTGLANVGAEVHVEQETPSGLGLSITSGKRLVELCTLSAKVEPKGPKFYVRVELDRYKTTQSSLFGFIPTGPKMILGYDPYKRFLSEVERRLRRLDPGASIDIGTVGSV